MNCSLVIATYNWPEALDLVLKSVMKQSVMPGEVLIADDGSREDTAVLIRSYQQQFRVPLIHMWQEDHGFRKTIILNKTYKQAKSEYIIQVDGDIVLHPHFIRDHLLHRSHGYFIKGSRGRLTRELTETALRNKTIRFSPLQPGVKSSINATHFPLASKLFYGKEYVSRNVKGCNFAVWKSDFVAVNGYDNTIAGWGHEDIDLAARLINNHVKRRQLKMAGVCFHLYHELASRSKEADNLERYYGVVEQRIVRCADGYDQV